MHYVFFCSEVRLIVLYRIKAEKKSRYKNFVTAIFFENKKNYVDKKKSKCPFILILWAELILRCKKNTYCCHQAGATNY